MKLRVGDPWMSGSEYGRSLEGLTLNILVSQIEPAISFGKEVLGAEVVYSDPDFAVLAGHGVEWMLHADHTYQEHPMGATVSRGEKRGSGVEFRLHGCDPDQAEQAARRRGDEILSPATDKGHGLRESYIRDPDGYVWVPDVHLPDEE